MTDLVPSEIACFASSPGRMRRTEVWISRDEIVDFLEYCASSIQSAKSAITRENKNQSPRTRCLGCDTLEDVVDERVEDGHRLVGDTSIGVHLLEHCNDKAETTAHQVVSVASLHESNRREHGPL